MATQKNLPATIVVGCKLPHGLILSVTGAPDVELNGTNSANIIGGYGLTEGVDGALFAQWLTVNHQHPAVVNGLIFAQASVADAKAQAKDGANIKNGFEGINPDKPAPGIEQAKG